MWWVVGRLWTVLTVLAPHVDDESERVPHPHGAGHAGPRSAVACADLHVALGGLQREHHRVARGHSVDIFSSYQIVLNTKMEAFYECS